jgi:spermidine synthase
VAAVLAAYMGGLALGSAAASRYAPRLRRPVLAYGLLELAIALSALSVPVGIQLINAAYVGLLGGAGELPEGGSAPATLFQLGAAFAVLLPPTAFMGATLPLLARHAVRSQSEIGSRVGVLYAVNTAGAIAGTLSAACWLMPELGLRRTVWCGAALNGLVFALAVLLARGAAALPGTQEPRPKDAPASAGAAWILPAIALSGAVSFGYEVLWTRLLGHLLGGGLDAFASMLASFLLGIALGSALAARLATRPERAAVGFGLAQLGIAITGYAVFALADRLPELSARLGAGPQAPLPSAAIAIAALLPITLCIGATFPFAVRLLAQSPEHAARATARVYAWNTMGAIVGALATGFLLLPGLGFEGTVNTGVGASLALALLTALASRPQRRRLVAAAVAAGVALLLLPARTPWDLLRASPMGSAIQGEEIVYSGVGRSSTVLLFDIGDAFRLYTNGLPEATIEHAGKLPLLNLMRLLGLLPGLLRPEASDLLAVGLGGGSLLESIPPSIRSIDVIELEPEVLAANRIAAGKRAIDPLADPRVRVLIADARGLLRLTEKRYDAVLSQPSHPWTAGASHLYTREFFSLVRSHLKPDGVFVQWMGLHFVDEPLLRSLAATLVGVFPNVEVYQVGGVPGFLFAASVEPLDSLASARRAMQANPEYFARFGFHRIEDFAAVRLLDAAGTRALAAGGRLNTDDHNLLAARASRLGDANLSTDRSLWQDHDPLLAGIDGLDRSALIRRLVAIHLSERATALALTQDEARRETELGLIDLRRANRGRAVRHFERALALAPDSDEAIAGLAESRTFDLARGSPVEGIPEAGLEGPVATVIAGWRHAEAGEWDAIEALEGALARIEPGEALFEEASRLRIDWRLAAADPALGGEALAIAERLLLRQWNPADALLHARAAILADRPREAWGSLSQIAKKLSTYSRSARIRAAALEVAKALPAELAEDVTARLRQDASQQPGQAAPVQG